MRIGEIAQRMECRTSAIRYYEKVGLLPAPERSSGRRVYGPAVLSRLAVIGYARRAGFSLSDIRQLFSGFHPRATAGRRWRTLAQKKLAEIEASMTALKEMERLVRNSLRCRCLDLDECGNRILKSPAS
jgi:MerR family redox-sensitive transcriptional activator SoxR